MAKCFDRDTIMVLRTNQDPDMTIPAVAVCPDPGFNFQAMEENGYVTYFPKLNSKQQLFPHKYRIPDGQWSAHEENQEDLSSTIEWRVPNNKSEVDRWHQISTFSFSDIVEKVVFHKV